MEQAQTDEFLNDAAQEIAQSPPLDEEDEQIIKGLAQSELTGRINNAAENYNIAQDLDAETLRAIGKEVYSGFKDDEDSRQDWLEMHTFWLSLYMQSDYAENSDAERAWGATESVPILMEACDQFQSRSYKIFFPNDTFVSAIPMRRTVGDQKELEARAERIGKHMSYQLGFEDRSYKQDKDALFLGVAIHGSFFTKTYFSEKHRRFKVDNIRPTDLVIPYHVGPVRMEDLRRKSHVIYTTVGATEDAARTGYLLSPAVPCESAGPEIYNIKVNETQGLTPSDAPTIKRDGPCILIEQHVYLDLDGQGEYRPYIATIDLAKQDLKRLTIGYEADQQGNPLDDYKQIQYFTHYKFKENPDGFYGLGLGHSIGDLNSAVNIMLRQSMDASTLANDGNMSGFISDRLGLDGDEIRMVLGKMIKIPDTVGDLTNAMMMMKFPGPNPALMQIMEAMDQRAQRLGSVTEATTGSPDKVVQPTTYLAQIEQSLEQFSSVQMRLANSLSEELQKIYKINQKYLPLVDYFVVNGAPEAITRADYKGDMLIQPIFDPKYATQAQKVARAQAELTATMENPVNQTRPQVYDEAYRRYFEALEVEDIDLLIPPQPQIENFDDQFMENMFFLMPKEARPLFDVFPEQNHLDHLTKLQELQSVVLQFGIQLTPDQQEDIFKHQQKHQAYLYGQTHGIVPTGQEPTPPLAARTDLQMAPNATTPSLSGSQAQLLSQIVGGSMANSGGADGSGNPAQATG